MRAGERACACPECGVVCQGLFDGCPDVWARGPRPVALSTAAGAGGNLSGGLPALDPGPEPLVAAAATLPPPASPPPRSSSYAPPQPRTNGFTSSPPPRRERERAVPEPRPEPAPADSRTEVLQWFEDAFDDLRNELHAVVSTVTRQQAMLAELLDTREAEMRVVLVAESLPELAGEAAAKALADESGGLAEVVVGYLDEFRVAVEASEESSTAVMDGMRELLQRVELTAEVNVEEARLEGAARLDALKASVARQLRPVAADLASLAAEVEDARERDAARTRALKASMTKQLQPLEAKLDAAVERSDRQLADIRKRLESLATATATAPAPARQAPARQAAVRRAPAAAKNGAPAKKAVAAKKARGSTKS